MVNYTAAARDVETGHGQETAVVLVDKKSSTGWMGKLFLAMFLVVVCCAGALLFVWFWNGRQEMQAVAGETDALIETKRTEPQYTVSRLSSKSKAAIHLEGSLQGEPGKEQLVWRSDQGQAFTQGGFQLTDNAIRIPATGLYFVYSQASFGVSCSDGDQDGQGPTSLSHRVWRHTDIVGTRTTLLSGVRSACQFQAPEGRSSEGLGWYNTIYLGAVFQLKAGDKLWTETNQLAELEADEGNTFFGVFAL